MSMKNSNDSIGNQTCDLPACRAQCLNQLRHRVPLENGSTGKYIIIIIIIIIIIVMSLDTRLYSLACLLNQRRFPPLRLPVLDCSTFRVMCDVPSTAVLCGEPTECFSVIAYKFFLKPLVTIPVASFITSIIIHFRFHIRCMSTYKLSYFSFFPASFCTTFRSVGIATSIGIHVLSRLFLIIIPGQFAVTFLSVHYYYYYYSDVFSSLWRCDPTRVMASSFLRFLDHT